MDRRQACTAMVGAAGAWLAGNPWSQLLSQDQVPFASTALRDYVAAEDASYRWTCQQSGKIDSVSWSRLHVVSQTWRGVPWRHVVWIFLPEGSTGPASERAMLHISGGVWEPKWPEEGPVDLAPGPSAARWLNLAKATGSPVVVAEQIPFQPMFDGLVEDQIISMTFLQYVKTGDQSWPLLFPMVKAAVRAMDAAQAHCQQQHHWKIDHFTAFGSSKRGWTTWLVAAVDRRIDAMAPTVIDVLNMEAQMVHQKRTWGKYSEQIADYSDKGLPDLVATPKGKELVQMVDPFAFRHAISQPKLLIFGTNDRYWPVDACSLYWDQLVGDKYLLYTPNQGHGIRDLQRMDGSLAALHRSRCGGPPLPKLQWHFEDQQTRSIELSMGCDPAPKSLQAWVARSETRDFRDAKWEPMPVAASDGKMGRFQIDREKRFVAVFGEYVFDHDPIDAYFSTNLRIYEPLRP